MKKKKKMEGFGHSWGIIVLLLLLVSLLVASTSVYMAGCLFELSLDREYIHYIWMQKCHENRYEMEYNDGIYRKDVKDVSRKRMLDYSTWMIFKEKKNADRNRNYDPNDSSLYFLHDTCHDDWIESVYFTGQNLFSYAGRSD